MHNRFHAKRNYYHMHIIMNKLLIASQKLLLNKNKKLLRPKIIMDRSKLLIIRDLRSNYVLVITFGETITNT